MRKATLLSILFVAGATCLFAQDIDVRVDPRIEMLEANGRYTEALALFLRDDETSPAAQYFAGDYYHHGRKGVLPDADKGKTYYRKALEGLLPFAEQGDAMAQYRVARCLEFGEADMKAAEAWYARAAEGGNTQAMCRSALFELARNPSGGFPAPLVRAAELGSPDAKAWQGARLVEREETQKAGVAILIEAVSGGSAIAMARLSALYYLGEGGVDQNLEMALRLLQEAVNKGFCRGATCQRASLSAVHAQAWSEVRPGGGLLRWHG